MSEQDNRKAPPARRPLRLHLVCVVVLLVLSPFQWAEGCGPSRGAAILFPAVFREHHASSVETPFGNIPVSSSTGGDTSSILATFLVAGLFLLVFGRFGFLPSLSRAQRVASAVFITLGLLGLTAQIAFCTMFLGGALFAGYVALVATGAATIDGMWMLVTESKPPAKHSGPQPPKGRKKKSRGRGG